MDLARGILFVAGGYVAIGALFALAFVTLGVERVDPGARGAGFFFRVLIAPACAALWPLMLVKWVKSNPEAHP